MQDQVTRGGLPHWYRPGFAHFVTYRLVDTIPYSVLQNLKQEREERLRRPLPEGTDLWQYRERVHKHMFARYDQLLDQTLAARWLTDEKVAGVIRENLYHHHQSKYELLAYSVMPNHVHVLLQPFASATVNCCVEGSRDLQVHAGLESADAESPLSKIMHSLKSYTANRANELIGRTGRFWQKESYDHWVRNEEELERIVAYIAANPVKAGLCQSPRDWKFSSAYDRYESDGSDCALVGWLRDDWRAR